MELTVEYIPALIVAKTKEGDYIKISEANKDDIYYCPVCGGKIKPRAIESKKVQPHFYHLEENGCSNESILHWMFKNWLFENGSSFNINEKEYVVSSFEIEKSFETPYGEYVPDLYIQTKSGEDMFFEINYSNSKDKTYADKWTYLNKTVLEVNVKELINCDIYGETPLFEIIFKDGEYLKKYKQHERKDKYVEFKNYIVNSRKEERVKYLVEKFDWFWREIKEEEDEDIKLCINEMDYDDAVNCTRFLKKIKCRDKFEICRDEVLDRMKIIFEDMIDDKNYILEIDHLSTQIYRVFVYRYIDKYKIGGKPQKLRTYDFMLNEDEMAKAVAEAYKSTKHKYESIEKVFDFIDGINFPEREVDKFIDVYSAFGRYDEFIYHCNVSYQISVFSDILDSWRNIYSIWRIDSISERTRKTIKNNYDILINDEHEKKEEEIVLKKINDIFLNCPNFEKKSSSYLGFGVNLNKTNKEVEIMDGKRIIVRCDFKNFSSINLGLLNPKIEDYRSKIKIANMFYEKINNCKNRLWFCDISRHYLEEDGVKLYISIEDRREGFRGDSGWFSIYINNQTIEEFKEELVLKMNKLLDYKDKNERMIMEGCDIEK